MKKLSLVMIFVLISAFLLVSCGSDSLSETMNATDEFLTTEKAPSKGEAGDLISTNGSDITPDSDAKIIRTVAIDGETKSFDEASESIKNQISEAGGYIESSETRGGESLSSSNRSARYADYVIRIPADKLDSFLERTEGLLNIISISESTEDVTLDYYDIEARLNTLETKRTALENMLSQATNLDDMLTIQDNLYDVIADIEAYQSQLNVYDNKVSYATVKLEISEVVEYTEVNYGEETFGERIAKAFTESWENFGEFCQDFIVFIVSALPVLVFPGIALIIILIVWLIRKKLGKKKEQAPPKNKD